MARDLTWEEIKVRRWITSNRGVLARVAVRCKCSHQFVQQVAYGRALAKHSECLNAVRSVLRDEGWPTEVISA